MTGNDVALVTLIGGGRTPSAAPAVYGPFLRAAGAAPRVACVVADEGDGDGAEQFARYEQTLLAVAPCTPVPVLVPVGTTFDVAALASADAVLVCGGLTPAYAASLAPAAPALREWCADGRPYAGFSAGSAVASASALVGGYRVDGRVVCPDDAGEDLEEVTLVPGLGLVPVTVDVHASTWGTLGRAVAAVTRGLTDAVLAIDEDTAVVVAADGQASVAGVGAVHVVRAVDGGAAVVTAVTAGGRIAW